MVEKNIFSIKSLYFSYGDNPVFRDISIDIGGGRILGILGPNGSGKSTFMRLLSKMVHPDRGNIELYNRDLEDYSFKELARMISYVPQNFYVNFNYDVYSIIETGRYPHMPNIFSSLSQRDLSEIERALREWELEELKYRSILDLSGGERQLTIIASSIAQASRIILFDEPTSNLDLKHIRLFMKNIRNRKQEYDLIIIVTHDINLASMLADYILCFPEQGGYIFNSRDAVLRREVLEEVFNTGIREEKGLFYIKE